MARKQREGEAALRAAQKDAADAAQKLRDDAALVQQAQADVENTKRTAKARPVLFNFFQKN